MSPFADPVFSTWVTFVSMQSTYTRNMSKNSAQIDIFSKHVDRIDASAESVEFSAKYRHNGKTCR